MQDINLPMFKSFHLLINVKMLQMFDVIGSNKLFVDRMNGLMLWDEWDDSTSSCLLILM